MHSDYVTKVATIPFWCPICGTLVKVGEIYVHQDTRKLCINEMPENETEKKGAIISDTDAASRLRKIDDDKLLQHLRLQNLRYRIDIEVLTTDPNSKAAKKIIARYRSKRKIDNELHLSSRN